MIATALAIELGEALQRRAIKGTHNDVQRCVQTQGHGWRQFPTPEMCRDDQQAPAAFEEGLDMFETLNVAHRGEPLRCEATHMTKIDEMLSQIAEGRACNLATLLGCFVGTKSDGKVSEGDTTAPGKHQVEQVTQTCTEPVRHP